jgi:hypothetical protein
MSKSEVEKQLQKDIEYLIELKKDIQKLRDAYNDNYSFYTDEQIENNLYTQFVINKHKRQIDSYRQAALCVKKHIRFAKKVLNYPNCKIVQRVVKLLEHEPHNPPTFGLRKKNGKLVWCWDFDESILTVNQKMCLDALYGKS